VINKFPFSIRQIAEILNLKIRYENNNNGNIDVDCPFCKKRSKMNLNAAKNVYRCNSCGEKGGMLELYGKIHNISNADAFRDIYEILKCEKTSYADGGNITSEQFSTLKLSSRADNNTIHQTYSMLLSLLTLATPHREQLLSRGLSLEQIDTLSYKSVPAFGQQMLCSKLLQIGCTLDGVPGFYRDNDEWNVKLKASGILIPVRGIDGKIAGIQIRLSKPINGRKYIWFSSSDMDSGASSGAPIHFIGDPTAKRIYVTDGSLKGTVAHMLTGYTFICLPDVKNLNGIDGLLVCFKANGTREAIEAFDIKKLTDEQTQNSAAKLRERLFAHGFKVISAVWEDKSLSGVDDYFLHRSKERRSHVYNVDIPAAVAV